MYGDTSRSDGSGSLFEALVRDAEARGVSREVAAYARSATEARLGRTADSRGVRVSAYYWGVIRRRALQGGSPVMRQRLLLTSFVEELTTAGHAPSRVYDELTRVYGGTVDPGLIEEYRPGTPAHAA